jgi:DNA polymerase (family 10)
MENREVASVFSNIARLLQLKNDSIFKIRAYQRAADAIEGVSVDITKLATDEKSLREIPGIGEAISAKIIELVSTGRLEFFEKLKTEFPPGLLVIMDVPGIGPKTALKAASDLGIQTLDDLQQAIESGQFANLPRVGDKTAQKILRQLKARGQKGRRSPIGVALPVALHVMDALRTACPGIRNLTYAGSLRRWRETIGDIDLLCTADHPAEVTRAYATLPAVQQVTGQGDTKATVVLDNGFQVDLRVVDDANFGALLLYFTGSQQHQILLRTRAQKMGLSLNEYGITREGSDRVEALATEEAAYRRLGLPFIPPELREAQGEIEAAEAGKLPDLIELADMRGDLHVHSDWSDGNAPVSVMVADAKHRGLEYVAMTDHSVGRGIANGLTVERLGAHGTELAAVEREIGGIRVFTGSEIDIRADGTLDYTDEVLAGLDVVVASVHSAMSQEPEIMTERIINAMRNPHVTIIGHLTTRLIPHEGREQGREPIEADFDAIFRAAADTGTLLEINASPNRLDLRDTHVRRAAQLGARFVVSTDAHAPGELDYMKYGIGTARRGWCERRLVANSLGAKGFERLIRTPKPERTKLGFDESGS